VNLKPGKEENMLIRIVCNIKVNISIVKVPYDFYEKENCFFAFP